MERRRWEQIQRLFDQVVELPAEKRNAFLGQACGEDDLLRSEIEALLQSADGGTEAIAGVVGAAADKSIDDLDRAGQFVGPYRLLRELGHGGMGTVHLAERADQHFEQRVAIKLVRGGFDGPEVLARFLAERQILAGMEHPNIARLLDGGATDDGAPFLAMEYIEGEPINAYCDHRQLPVADRLELFRKVCDAVQHAHRSLVVHRDLKPSNILVTVDGSPKLLDFGIAKLLDETKTADTSEITQTTGGRLTPAYASPEQMRRAPITTATDVYSLGVVLYELLTGRLPLLAEGGDVREIERMVCDVDPPKPSSAVLDPSPSRAAQWRDPHRLSRRLAGDLDNITMKALAKRPGQRYPSVDQLSEDIRRHLVGLPVTARTLTITYRVRKFLRRHRTGVTAAAAALLLLSTVVAFYTVRLSGERDRAQQEADRAQASQAMLIDLFEVVDPLEAEGQNMTARELLDRRRERVDELEDQPELQASMLDAMGRIYRNLGLFEEAEPLLREALSKRQALFPDQHLETAASLHNLAILENNLGRYREAEELAHESLVMRRALLSEDDLSVTTSLQTLAIARDNQGDFEGAEAPLREALGLRRQLTGDDSLEVSETLNVLATLLFSKSDYQGAEELYREALAAARTLPPGSSISFEGALVNLGAAIAQQGRMEEAVPLFQEALPLLRERLGNDHPELADYLRNYGTALRGTGEHQRAADLYREALAIQTRAFGPEHHEVAKTSFSFAELLQQQGELEEAEVYFRRCVAVIESLLGAEHPHYGRATSGLASVRLARGDQAGAAELFDRAVSLLRTTLPSGHDLTAIAEIGLGRALAQLGRCDEAVDSLQKGSGSLRAKFPSGHPHIARAETAIAACAAGSPG